MEVDTGRVVAMASYPTYNPEVWVGGISNKQYKHLSSEQRELPVAEPGDPGTVRAGVDIQGRHDVGGGPSGVLALRLVPVSRRRSRSVPRTSPTSRPTDYGDITLRGRSR